MGSEMCIRDSPKSLMPDPASKRFQPVENNVSLPKLEESILEFWREKDIYDRSLQQREGAEKYVFFEGPPTANGKPHPGHCLTRAIKDVFPRYKTMKGFYCRRKAGWDTHGLPVEVEVCKELGIHSKEDIDCLLYTSPSPRDLSTSRMPSSA